MSNSTQFLPNLRGQWGYTRLMASFEGFPKGGTEFFQALTLNMNREWFQLHKGDYVRLWHEPMQAFLTDLQAGLSRAYPKVKDGEAKVMRVYRDVRFSKDKTPYKTSASGVLSLFGDGKAMSHTSLYCEFGKDTPFLAMGRWMLEPDELARFRRAVAEDKTGAPFAKAALAATKAGFELNAYEVLKKVPKGFDADHPRGDLLRLKGFALALPKVPAKLPASAELVPWVVEHATSAKGVMHWLEAAVTAGKLPKL